MVKAIISNDETVHAGNFGINVVISHPISGLTIRDFVFQAESGNGITDIVLPADLEVAYLPETVFMIPIEVPENVIGSFNVSMLSKLYTVDNTQYETSSEEVVLPPTEQQHIACEAKEFYYNTRRR